MPSALKLLIVTGARPNFMKVAPLIHVIEAWNAKASPNDRQVDWRLVHTGQHYDAMMSDVFFKELRIPKPQFYLDVGSGSHAIQTANVMEKFEPVLLDAFASIQSDQLTGRRSDTQTSSAETRPDWVIVVGDVNSTVACALVATKIGVRVAHVEAGLRSFDRSMPEEINRLVTDTIADLLLTPSEDGNENLRREGVPEQRIQLVGNIMIDSLAESLCRARQSTVMKRMGVAPGGFVYLTLHRPSNVDTRESLAAIIHELQEVCERLPVIFPAHPRTRKMLNEFGLIPGLNSTLKIVDPIGYHDSLCLTENSRLVLTDSGGLQEEATYFRTPCLTLRPNTERPITISVGSNRLTKLERLAADVEERLNGPTRLGERPPLWDGFTAARILKALVDRA